MHECIITFPWDQAGSSLTPTSIVTLGDYGATVPEHKEHDEHSNDPTVATDEVPDHTMTYDPPNPDERSARERGMAKMQEVYGFTFDPATTEGDYSAFTVDHLFGSVWTRPGLDLKERRLLTIGVLAALGLTDLLGIQFDCVLRNGELDEQGVRETVLHLTHYIGWPLSTGLQRESEAAIARSRAAAHDVKDQG